MNYTIKELRNRFRKKEISSLEITKEYIQKIKEEDIGAFISFSEELAIKYAKEADAIIEKGEDNILTGIPFSLKDAILARGFKNTSGSRMLENYIPDYSATSFERLKEKGAVLLGKTNLDEFAMGSSTENSAFFPTKNPKDKKRVPGGSSGGSAAAVAANLSVFSLGSDTGGSIRQPSSFCGVVGLKPTYGSVSRYGLSAFGSSLDQIGPIAKNVEDVETVFEAIRGKDENDSTSVDYSPKRIKDKIKIGIPKEYFVGGIEKEVEKSIYKEIEKVKKMGFEIKEISLPHTKYALSAYYIMSTSEVSANLARYDGIRYGLSKEGDNLFDVYAKTRGEGFGKEVKRRIILGTYALSSGYYDAFYLKAQKVRRLVSEDFQNAFKEVDLIISPVSPFPAFKIGEKKDALSMYLCDIYTIPVSLAGIPALSVPLKKEGLPVGLQIIGNYFDEGNIFNFAKKINE